MVFSDDFDTRKLAFTSERSDQQIRCPRSANTANIVRFFSSVIFPVAMTVLSIFIEKLVS
jgi:hypothetical protein